MTTATKTPASTFAHAGAPPPDLTRPELLRYARHLVMPEVGIEGSRSSKRREW